MNALRSPERLMFFLVIGYSLGLLWEQLNGNFGYWEIAWDSSLWEAFATDWDHWLNSSAPRLELALRIAGIILSGLFSLLFFKKWQPGPIQTLSKTVAWSLSVFLLAYMFWGWYSRSWLWPWMAEHSIRIALPVLLFYWIYGNERQLRLTNIAGLVALSLTFAGHGWFAMNLAPIPGDFLYMTTRILHVGEPAARHFLWIMGMLDLIAVLCFWIKSARRPALWYAFAWGMLTALARLVGHFYVEIPLESINEWMPEVLVRLGHGLVPLLFLLKNEGQNPLQKASR
ncbi:MAG: hypothetical protein R3B47_03935 [Bacteroidia bacterium]